MKALKKILPWMIGLLAATVLFAGLLMVCDLRYENSDDMLFVKGFMGFEGGEPVSFTLYTHTFLAWILYGLSKAFSLIPWFSVFQVGLLWLSTAVIVKCLMQLGRGKGVAGGAVFLGVFAAFACARLSYTTTAAMAGAAAAVQLMTLREDKRTSGLLLAVLLLMAAYSLRQMTVLPLLAYCLLVLCFEGAKRFSAKKNLRPVIVSAAVLLGVLAVFAGVREVEITARGQRETLSWQKSRIELFDYTSFESNIAPALAADSGLSDKQAALVQQWHFWDSDLDAEAFQAMTKAYADEEKDGVFKKLGDFLRASPRYVCAIALLMLLAGWIALCDEKPRWASLTAALALLGGLVMIIYLCWRGRVLFRGLDTVFFPCAAVLLALAVQCRPKGRKALAVALCIAMVAVVGADAYLTLDVLREKPDWVSQQREAELEAFALQNPDKLIVRTPNLLRDTRLFPDVRGGLPVNTAIWGDWYCRMPGWRQQVAKYGLVPDHISLADWTSEAMVFAADASGVPQALLDGVSEAVGHEVKAEVYGAEGTLTFYQLK